MKRLLLSALLTLGGFASAQEIAGVDQPTAEELRQELFGAHLYGIVDFDTPWNECIEPDGDTLYTIGGEQERGKTWVPRDGEICFNYGGPDHCFQTYRNGEEYIFRGAGTVWRTTKIRDNVEFCLLSDMIS